jgi:hypothetical protein
VPEPIVPTGREIEEGTAARHQPTVSPPRSLLKRILRRDRGENAKPISEIHLEVPPHVAERPTRKGRSEPASQADVDQADLRSGTELPSDQVAPTLSVNPSDGPPRNEHEPNRQSLTPDDPAHASTRATPRPDPAFRVQDQAGGNTGEFVAAIIMLSRRPAGDVREVLEPLIDTVEAHEDRQRTTWWLGLEGAQPSPAPSCLASDQLTDLDLVVEWLMEVESGAGRLGRYQEQVALWDAADSALRKLRRRARDFPSLERLVNCLDGGDLQGASLSVDYDSASWAEASHEISTATGAAQRAITAGERPLMVALPRVLKGHTAIHVAVMPTLCTPSSVESRLDPAIESLRGQPVRDLSGITRSLVERIMPTA